MTFANISFCKYGSSRTGFKPVRERGVIMFVTLIALVILMISAIAMVRSFDTSLVLAGNLAFKRDLINQGERGVAAAKAEIQNPAQLGTAIALQTSAPAFNYSATLLPSDAHGLPLMITNDALWTMTGADIVDATTGVTIRFVIDRLCNLPGPTSTASCIVGSTMLPTGGTANVSKGVPNGPIVYRVSVRVSGPRNTQSFMQTTLSM